MLTRTLSAAVLIPLVALVTWAGGWILAAVLLAVSVRALYEMFLLMRAAGYRPSLPIAGLIVAGFLVAARYPDWPLFGLVLAAAVIGTLAWQLRCPPDCSPTQSWAVTLGGALWIGWLIGHMLLIRDLAPPFSLGEGTRWLALTFLATWINDSAAYIAGSLIGRHYAFPYLSPKKTWEGTIGGWIGGVAATMVLGHFLVALPWLHGLILGALIATVAPLGDLAKSMVKRQYKVKDFANLIPGHGGMFDRVDSLLFVAPVVYYYVTMVVK